MYPLSFRVTRHYFGPIVIVRDQWLEDDGQTAARRFSLGLKNYHRLCVSRYSGPVKNRRRFKPYRGHDFLLFHGNKWMVTLPWFSKRDE